MRIFDKPNYNFIKWRWHAIALSALIIIAGLVSIATKGMPLGIDFSGGTIVVLKFQQPVAEDGLRTAACPNRPPRAPPRSSRARARCSMR